MAKSPDAFRTISEVADWLDVPTHVLRFWESRFSQIKPVKRAGGRRYYRPSDMRLIGGIKVLLHDDGLTIRGVQKLLREQGVKHIAGHSPALDTDSVDGADASDLVADDVTEATAAKPAVSLPSDEEDAQVVPAPAARTTHEAAPDPITAISVQSPEPAEIDADTPSSQGEMFPEAISAPKSNVTSEREVPSEQTARPAGAAAQILAAAPDRLSRHRDVLQDVADRLSKLRAGHRG